MPEWTKRRLEEVVQLKRGFDLATRDRRPGPFPVVGSAGISGWHDEGPIPGPALVLGRAGSSMGVASYCETERFWPLNTSLFVEDFKGNDPRFLFHLFQLTDLTGYNSGSAQPMLNRNYIRDVAFLMPGIEEQRAISDVLKALDDKITINDRIAACCDRLAQISYENASKGNPEVSLASVAVPILGGTPDRTVASYWGDGNLWASARDVVGARFSIVIATNEEITDLAVQETRVKPVPKGSVILTARGTVGIVARVGQPTSFNQSCYAFVPEMLPPGCLYLTVRYAAQRMLAMAHGTVFSTVNMKTFDHIRVPSFSNTGSSDLETRVSPLLDTVESRVRESILLAELRGMLLPKLMSGEIRVRDAEKVVEEVT